MRPLRLLLLLACFIALPIFLTFISLVTAHPRNGDAVASTAPRTSGLRALFSFQTPSSLFPPSAMISLTDDNTTFFIAKPADFGPDLPGKGLNGQLWVGVGFGEDILRDDGVLASAEGELGCSDVPGWDGISKKGPRPSPLKTDVRKVSHGEKVVTDSAKEVAQKGGDSTVLAKTDAGEPRIAPIAEDGTDDHLHHPLPESGNPNAASPVHPVVQENTVDKVTPTAHADIQSLQESAEIAGKIVLLRRGGCGFLEKVKWAQRRGAIAVIVGDNARHGSLLTMYARGDTSNITIPSVFTSHTTAHLLSSLLPPEAVDDALAMESKPAPGYTNANSKPKSAEGDSSGALNLGDRESKIGDVQTPISSTSDRQSWIRSLLNAVGLGRDSATAEEDSRRPPSSGNIDWVLVEDFEDDDSTVTSKDKSMDDETSYMSSTKSKPSHDKTTKHAGADDFVIGEQDWRDPDLLKPTHKATDLEKDMSKVESSTDQSSHEEDTHTGRLKGGSITPGSGEYHHPPSSAGGKGSRVKGTKNETPSKASSGRTGKNWLGWLTTAHDEHTTKDGSPKGMEIIPQSDLHVSKPDHVSSSQTKVMHKDEDHEGLWITLTPTSMSTSPFLDTLLVLVVSPLVTLTVVYALLLLRSRIRRRRWRAPKSVVERLPVRTYHTMSTSAVSSQLSSPDTSSPTTPLLRATASTRTRPRSRTASSLPTGSEASDTSAAACTPPEKNRPGTAWRRRYTGRQVECVVCLEEYIDGQSRVMSLPCGHEFHVECITPWLTTRRRTCPICKGDVVRSMAQMGHYNNQEVDTQNSSDDFQDIAAEARNDSPSAAIPIPRGEGEADQDLERAGDEAGEAVGHGAQSGRRGWRNMLSLSALSGDTIWAGRQTPVDRNRSPTLTAPPFAFAFDIDGVLLRSSAPLPGAIKTLRYLQSRNVPFILLTNGGGKTEQQRVEDLTQTLEVPLDTKNFIQSHTPFKELTIGQPGGGEGLKEKNVLIMGGEGGKCREVAESYGFKHAITPGDILVAHPGIWPFSRQWIDTYYKPFARPLPKPIITDPTISHSASQLSSLTPETNLQVSSIHVYNDPRDWGLDTTIILDLLLSHRGFLGTRSRLLGDTSLPNRGYQQDGQPTLWFSNPDLEWAASYHHPRLGQGGFREAFEGVWRAMTDPDNAGDVALKKTVIGKPFHDTYSYAEKILTTFRKELSESQGVDGSAELYRVYMIGDNPESDIRGANDYKSPQGTQWNSVLLRSGVYDEDAMGKPRYEPKIIMDDVWSGVQWALEKEGWCIDG